MLELACYLTYVPVSHYQACSARRCSMALDDFMESEVAVAAAATAAVFSPRVRGVLRRGAVLGLAGALMAGDALATFTHGVARSAQRTATSTATAVQEVAGATARAA